MVKLQSEQLPSDGSFQLHKLLKRANERLGKLGKHGKRAKLKQSGSSITLQFNFHGQKNPGCGCNFTKNGIAEAVKIAELVTSQLSANSFNWDWFNSLIGKEIKKEELPKHSCRELIANYKIHWKQENRQLKNAEGSWYKRFRHLENVMDGIDTELTSSLVKQIVESSENNTPTRTYVLQGFTCFLEYFDISEYDHLIQSYKAKNKPLSKKRNVPSDEQIKTVFSTGFIPCSNTRKDIYYRYAQWQFLYGLLAVYGLRVHEAWHIANWSKPVLLHQGDWVAIEDSDEYKEYKGNGIVIPAILDPNNSDKILCIKHATKTGYRMAIPISPEGENWLIEFNLLQPLNLPDLGEPLIPTGGKHCYKCTNRTGLWFRRRNYGFAPHDLRHAYNHRGHHLGYNATTLSSSLGHSLEMNSTTYLKTMPDIRKMQMMKEAIHCEKEKQSELERLKSENEFLKQEIEKLKCENQLYKSLLEQIRLR